MLFQEKFSLLAAYPKRGKEVIPKDSRRIWRGDPVKHMFWNQQAGLFLESKRRIWVLKSEWWDWQMSREADHLPQRTAPANRPGKTFTRQTCFPFPYKPRHPVQKTIMSVCK